MNAAISLQIVTHAILWTLMISLEVAGESLLHGETDVMRAFHWSFLYSLLSLACFFRLGKSAILRDIQELYLYNVFAQVFAMYLIWTRKDLMMFVYVERVIMFLKFFRILWINPALTFGADSGWPVFGIIGYWQRCKMRRRGESVLKGDRRIYAVFLVALLFAWVTRLADNFLTYLVITLVVSVLVVFFYDKIIRFYKNAEQERIEAMQKLAVANATAEINAQLSEKNRQLLLANQERDVMLADLMVRNECLRDASHDLAAPAFWITSCSQQLVAAKDDQARKELALQLLDSVSHYNQLLQATIHGAKIMTRIEMPQPVPVSVNKLANYLWDKYMGIFEEKGLRFSIYKSNQYLLADDGSVSVDIKSERTALNFYIACDEQVLMRILNNLIMNALRNTSEGRVHVAFRKRQHGICWVEVRDTGSGFDDADGCDWQANFNQVAQRIKGGKMKASEAASHGLGINNMKNLCASIGSTMLLHSRSGRGTLFRFALPLVEGEPTLQNDHKLELAEEFV